MKVWLSTVVALLLWLGATPARAGGINETLERAAEQILEYALKQNPPFRNVGVLKFLVETTGEGLRDSVGSLNMSLARRLEIALIMVNDNKKPVGVIDNASAVAARIPGADHRTDEGIRKLLTAEGYERAWGHNAQDYRVTADALIRGKAIVDPKRLKLTIQLECCSKDATKTFPPLEVDATALDLQAVGKSYVLRGEPGLARPKLVALADDKDLAVELEIFYGQERQFITPLKDRSGEFAVETPKTGQLVSFKIKRRDTDKKERLAIVLKVNGVNTLYMERETPLNSYKWVLEQDKNELTVSGFQKKGESTKGQEEIANRFLVQTVAALQAQGIYYGEDTGTIELVVFRTRKQVDSVQEESPIVPAVIEAERKLPVKPLNPGAARNQLTDQVQPITRLRTVAIGPGAEMKSAVKEVAFHLDPNSALALTIRYVQRPALEK